MHALCFFAMRRTQTPCAESQGKLPNLKSMDNVTHDNELPGHGYSTSHRELCTEQLWEDNWWQITVQV
jgi:hypothetical protein